MYNSIRNIFDIFFSCVDNYDCCSFVCKSFNIFFTTATSFTSHNANGSNKINTIGLKYTISPMSFEFVHEHPVLLL